MNIKPRFCRDGSIVFKLADGCPGGAVKLRIGLTNALEKAYNCLPNVKKNCRLTMSLVCHFDFAMLMSTLVQMFHHKVIGYNSKYPYNCAQLSTEYVFVIRLIKTYSDQDPDPRC